MSQGRGGNSIPSLSIPDTGLRDSATPPLSADATCGAESYEAERLPLDLYIMLDTSGSMANTLADGVTTKWMAVQKAVTGFLQDPASSGLGVGLQFFPIARPGIPDSCESDSDCGQAGPCQRTGVCDDMTTLCTSAADCAGGGSCNQLGYCQTAALYCSPIGGRCSTGDMCIALPGYCVARDSCEPSTYASPSVEVAQLPTAATRLVNAMKDREPDGLTPTSAVLSGALSHAKSRASQLPNHRIAVVLATDGLPTECSPEDIPSIATIAATAAGGSPAIRTFVIGVFAPEEEANARSNLDTLASAGGTDRAFVINTNQNVTSSFQAALESIRTTALACEYAIPSPEGGAIDFGKVNVKYTSGAGQTTTIGYASAPINCAKAGGGWYYDINPKEGGVPTKIVVCEATCTQFKADPVGKVDIALGCATEEAVIN